MKVQPAQLIIEAGCVEVARGPEVSARRARRARLTRAGQELDMLKRLGHPRPADPVKTCQHIAPRQAHVPVRQLCRALHVAPSTYHAWPTHMPPAL